VAYSDPLFLGAAPGGYSSQEFNKLGGFIGTSGVSSLNDLTPSGSGTTMSFTAGRAIIQGTDTTTQGHYLCRSTATQTYTLPGGVASSSHERIDYLIAKVYDDPIAVVSGGSDEWKIVAVTGTEAAVGSAVAPSLASVTSYIPIATAKVNSSGIVSVTDQRVLSNHPSLLDTSGAVRFVDKTTANETISGAKKFTGGIQRGASGRVRGYTHLVATRTTTYSLANIAIATDAFTVIRFNFINANASDNGFAYDSATGIMTLDGGYAISGMVSIKCPSGYGGVRLVTGTGVVVYQLVLASTNSPFDFLSLPFSWTGDYVGTMTVQAGQQSSAAQTQPANDNSNNPVRLEVVGVC
jgi:hypothetical protein